jgi:hypothetical protein
VGTSVTALTFGSTASLEETKKQVAQALGVAFIEHDSGYRGGRYYKAAYCAEHVLVQRNDDGGEPAESAWSGPAVVYVEAADDAVQVEAALPVLTLLSRQEWTRE